MHRIFAGSCCVAERHLRWEKCAVVVFLTLAASVRLLVQKSGFWCLEIENSFQF